MLSSYRNKYVMVAISKKMASLMWTKKERFEAVLNHELADRPPVSAWRHFTENEHSGADLFVETMLKWQNTYDWDYVKLQPRASYYEEAWGGQFDYNDYEGVLPKVVKGPIGGVADLEKITADYEASPDPYVENRAASEELLAQACRVEWIEE